MKHIKLYESFGSEKFDFQYIKDNFDIDKLAHFDNSSEYSGTTEDQFMYYDDNNKMEAYRTIINDIPEHIIKINGFTIKLLSSERKKIFDFFEDMYNR